MSQDQLKTGLDESLQEAPKEEVEIIKDEAWAMMVELYPEEFSLAEQARANELVRAYSDENDSEWQELSKNLKEFTKFADDYEPKVQGPMGLSDQGKDQVMKFAINVVQAQQNNSQNSSRAQASLKHASMWQEFLQWSRSLSLSHPVSWAFIMGIALIGTWSVQVSMNEPQLDAPFHMMSSKSAEQQFNNPPADEGLLEKDSDELNEKFAQVQNLNQSPRGSNQLIDAQEDKLNSLLEEPLPEDNLAQKSQMDNQAIELERSDTNKRQPVEARPRVKPAKSEAKSKPKRKPKRTSRLKRNLKKKTSRRQARKAEKARKSKARKRKARSRVANKSASSKSDGQKKTARRTISKTKGVIANSLSERSNKTIAQAEPQTKPSSTRSSASISPSFAPPPPQPAPAKKASSSTLSSAPVTSSSRRAYDSAVPKSQPQTTYSRSKANQQEQAQEEIPAQEQEQIQALGSSRSSEKTTLEEAPQEAEELEMPNDEEADLNDDKRTEMNLPPPPWQDAIETWAQGQRSVALNRLLLWIDKHPYHQQRMTAIRLGLAWAQSLNNDDALTKLEAYRSQKQMRKSRRQRSNDSRPAASESRPASLSY